MRIRLTSDFSIEAMSNRKQWNTVFRILTKNDCLLKILYLGHILMKCGHRLNKIFRNAR